MNRITKNKRILQRLQTNLNSQLTFVKRLKLGLIILPILITACSKEENIVSTKNCPEISLTIKEDTNDKTKIIVQAALSLTKEVTYKWKVTDEKGTHEVNDNTGASLSWKAKNGETKFCVTINTPDCNEKEEKCITYNLSCDDTIQTVASRVDRGLFSKPVFKDDYMYYAEQKNAVLTYHSLVIYKLKISDENATPIKLLEVENLSNGSISSGGVTKVFGDVNSLVFKDDILYISISNFILHSKVYKINTSAANPKLIEVLDWKLKDEVREMIIKGDQMYAIGFKSRLFKSGLTNLKLEFNEVVNFNPIGDFRFRTLDMVYNGNELFILASGNGIGLHIIKVDINDPNLKQTIIISNLDNVYKMDLYNDELYLLVRTQDNNGSFISKLNITNSSSSLEKISKIYDFKVREFTFHNQFMYLSVEDDSKNKYELVKVPFCSL